MAGMMAHTRTINTNDGVRLQYLEAGAGQPLVMIPGWSQTAEQFKFQLEGLSNRYRVIAVDMRGHGESSKPAYGYRIARLSKDVHELLTALDLHEVVLLGHSVGASIIWSYYDLFGPERLAKLILVDQVPVTCTELEWTDEERTAATVVFAPQVVSGLIDSCAALAGPNGVEATKDWISGMVTAACDPAITAWMVECNLRMPRSYAATLLLNHCTQDWRDVIPRITLPTLIVSGRISFSLWQSQQWIHECIPGSRLEIFEEQEGGQHFMFVEGAAKFNQIVADFIG